METKSFAKVSEQNLQMEESALFLETINIYHFSKPGNYNLQYDICHGCC